MEELPQPDLFDHADQYRRVNEGIHRSGDSLFLCECLRADCNELVELGAGEYEAVRADAARFFVLPGHELELDIVERQDGYIVVSRVAPGFRGARRAPGAARLAEGGT